MSSSRASMRGARDVADYNRPRTAAAFRPPRGDDVPGDVGVRFAAIAPLRRGRRRYREPQ